MASYLFKIDAEEADGAIWLDLPNDAEVMAEAVRTAAGYLTEHDPPPANWGIAVTDKSGRQVARVAFSVSSGR